MMGQLIPMHELVRGQAQDPALARPAPIGAAAGSGAGLSRH
jgi:hypothetical protein